MKDDHMLSVQQRDTKSNNWWYSYEETEKSAK